MAEGAETLIAETYIVDTLLADTAVTNIIDDRLYQDVAPKNATYPFIVYQNQAANDVRGVGSTLVMVTTMYVVKAIAQTDDFAVLRPLVEAVQAALTVPEGGAVTGGGNVFACIRENPFRLTETAEDGKQYRHLGGIYRLQVQG